MVPLTLKMRILEKLSGVFRPKNNITRSNSRAHLLEGNINIQGDCAQDVNRNSMLDHNTFNTYKELNLEHHLDGMLQELTELLRVPPGAAFGSSVDGCCPKPPESDLEQHKKACVDHLIQISVSMHIPELPADLDQDLQQHLCDLQKAVCDELLRLGPALEAKGLMGQLINCYHCQIFNHLDSLLLKVKSSKSCFALIKWGLKTYLSQEMLSQPDHSEIDPIKHVDILLLSEWGVMAQNKLLEIAQKEIRGHLENILKDNREQHVGDEAFVQTYVDTIRCIAAMPTSAQIISSRLSYKVKEVCFQELHAFVERYGDEQTAVLKKMAKADEPEMIHFFKTLKTCQELKKHIETQGEGITISLRQEIVTMLADIEDLTLKHLRGIVTKIVKKHLQVYFRAKTQEFVIIDVVKKMLSHLEDCDDVRKIVTPEVYKIIVHSYIEHLLKTKRKKLQRRWSSTVEKTMSRDAAQLHGTMSHLDPGVHQYSSKLEKIKEVLDCSDHDALKMTVAVMQKESLTASEDLRSLLRWKGLSTWEVSVVLDAIPDEYHPGAGAGAGACCLCL